MSEHPSTPTHRAAVACATRRITGTPRNTNSLSPRTARSPGPSVNRSNSLSPQLDHSQSSQRSQRSQRNSDLKEGNPRIRTLRPEKITTKKASSSFEREYRRQRERREWGQQYLPTSQIPIRRSSVSAPSSPAAALRQSDHRSPPNSPPTPATPTPFTSPQLPRRSYSSPEHPIMALSHDGPAGSISFTDNLRRGWGWQANHSSRSYSRSDIRSHNPHAHLTRPTLSAAHLPPSPADSTRSRTSQASASSARSAPAVLAVSSHASDSRGNGNTSSSGEGGTGEREKARERRLLFWKERQFRHQQEQEQEQEQGQEQENRTHSSNHPLTRSRHQRRLLQLHQRVRELREGDEIASQGQTGEEEEGVGEDEEEGRKHGGHRYFSLQEALLTGAGAGVGAGPVEALSDADDSDVDSSDGTTLTALQQQQVLQNEQQAQSRAMEMERQEQQHAQEELRLMRQRILEYTTRDLKNKIILWKRAREMQLLQKQQQAQVQQQSRYVLVRVAPVATLKQLHRQRRRKEQRQQRYTSPSRRLSDSPRGSRGSPCGSTDSPRDGGWEHTRQHLEREYLLFLKAVFPENIEYVPVVLPNNNNNTKNKNNIIQVVNAVQVVVDQRVTGTEWLSAFSSSSSSDLLYELGPPPGSMGFHSPRTHHRSVRRAKALRSGNLRHSHSSPSRSRHNRTTGPNDPSHDPHAHAAAHGRETSLLSRLGSSSKKLLSMAGNATISATTATLNVPAALAASTVTALDSALHSVTGTVGTVAAAAVATATPMAAGMFGQGLAYGGGSSGGGSSGRVSVGNRGSCMDRMSNADTRRLVLESESEGESDSENDRRVRAMKSASFQFQPVELQGCLSGRELDELCTPPPLTRRHLHSHSYVAGDGDGDGDGDRDGKGGDGFYDGEEDSEEEHRSYHSSEDDNELANDKTPPLIKPAASPPAATASSSAGSGVVDGINGVLRFFSPVVSASASTPAPRKANASSSSPRPARSIAPTPLQDTRGRTSSSRTQKQEHSLTHTHSKRSKECAASPSRLNSLSIRSCPWSD